MTQRLSPPPATLPFAGPYLPPGAAPPPLPERRLRCLPRPAPPRSPGGELQPPRGEAPARGSPSAVPPRRRQPATPAAVRPARRATCRPPRPAPPRHGAPRLASGGDAPRSSLAHPADSRAARAQCCRRRAVPAPPPEMAPRAYGAGGGVVRAQPGGPPLSGTGCSRRSGRCSPVGAGCGGSGVSMRMPGRAAARPLRPLLRSSSVYPARDVSPEAAQEEKSRAGAGREPE